MRAIVFVHKDTNQQVVCACIQQIERFLDNRNPEDWIGYPASAREVRQARQ